MPTVLSFLAGMFLGIWLTRGYKHAKKKLSTWLLEDFDDVATSKDFSNDTPKAIEQFENEQLSSTTHGIYMKDDTRLYFYKATIQQTARYIGYTNTPTINTSIKTSTCYSQSQMTEFQWLHYVDCTPVNMIDVSNDHRKQIAT